MRWQNDGVVPSGDGVVPYDRAMSAAQDDSGKTTIRVYPPELRARLDTEAAKHRRSRNAMIMWIVEQWLDQHAPVTRDSRTDAVEGGPNV
jgi:predicted transcriptional regulator